MEHEVVEVEMEQARSQARRGLVARLARIYERTWFPAVDDVAAHVRKLELFRVLVGLVAGWRFFEIATSGATYFDADTSILGIDLPTEALLAYGMTTLFVLLTIGLFTPLVAGALFLLVQPFDSELGTVNLGSFTLQVSLLLIIVGGVGRSASVDAWLARRAPGWASAPSRAVHAVTGALTRDRLAAAYLLAFLAYALLHLGAIQTHLADRYWVEGRTVEVMLANPYLSRAWRAGRWLQEAAPTVAFVFSASAVALQSVFQVLMIPFAFWRWGHLYNLLFGLGFFVMSLTLLQLSYLPVLELVLWFVLFTPPALLARIWARTGRWSPGLAPRIAAGRGPGTGLLAGAWIALLVVFVLNMGHVRATIARLGIPRGPIPSHTAVQVELLKLGMVELAVFNETDLTMGDSWPVLYRGSGADRELVPFSGPDGERLAYHDSDVIYFGNSLSWRRAMVRLGHPDMRDGDDFWCWVELVARYDARRQGVHDVTSYSGEVWQAPLSDLDVSADRRTRAKRRQVFTMRVDPDARRSRCHAAT